ncbi:Haloalkane dehalogenase, putative [Chondrus crispus]|uniref:Haloalkane dehalogenase, putative n=1 Tax=Chondrus crispus TaxID=2769 RepID=R7QPZ1_CHOCR|nr:Haloalkane dehalogenase, putative [Chondrus crispus]CDF40552.1 Haloalkane dehalogenase, putative [Chondrus crispus]|eukprot:XP_005710846.1 Haloalkane dehalogenase, putative [Chondrus crispus]
MLRLNFPLTTLLLLLSLSLCSLAQPSRDSGPSRFTRKKYVTISGKRMAYVEVGTGDPIVFLHGNPTSSYLWRNIMPFLEGKGRLIAPDLIGMGDSDKLDNSGPNRYTFVEHTNYLFPLLEAIGVKERVTLVIHDWGSALGFLWAYYNRNNPEAVKAIVFFEALVAPFPSFDELPDGTEEFFRPLRSPAGEKLVLQENFFLEEALFGTENFSEKDKAVYRRPYLKPGESRRPMLTWPRQIPIGGKPADVTALIGAYSKWLGKAKIRKLFINAEPGILSSFARPIVRKWPMLTEVTVPGFHFIQESVPDRIGRAIKKWL